MDRREPSRTRAHGTKVSSQQDGAGIVAACRSIVDRGQYAKVNGLMVDLFSASAIVKVHDALNDTNREKFLRLPVHKMAAVCFKVLK
jgi:hypothetical protein